VIEIKNLTKSFGEKTLFNNFNLTVDDGEFLVIAGKSGCGKTTLLNMLGGIEPFDSGSILSAGCDVKKRKSLKEYYLYKVGFLFQNFALVENKTVRQNIELVQKKSRTQRTVEEVLESVGLQGFADEKVYKLSGGEQQRVALARLIYKKCEVILADEPTGSLDKENAEMVLNILKKMNAEGRTVILVTHDEGIMSQAQRVISL